MTDSRPSQLTNDTTNRERALDWLTALLPAVLMSIFYYRWQAAALELLAIAGYLMAAYLLAPTGTLTPQLFPAMVTGLLTAFCLPATTPLWPAALAGAVAAVTAALPALWNKYLPRLPKAQALVHPALVGYLFIRLLFPGTVDSYTMPAQWSGVDGLTVATPLAVFGGTDMHITHQHLLLGIHAATIGEGCAIALVLGILFLLIRQRLRIVAPVCMLATLSLLSWAVWGSPLYCLLAGGALLGAVILADREYTTPTPGQQALMGVLAGVGIVLLRRFAGMEGTAVAVVAVGLLQPVLPYVIRGCKRLCQWLWPLLVRFFRWLGRKLAPLWPLCLRGCRRLGGVIRLLLGKIQEKFRKSKNNG